MFFYAHRDQSSVDIIFQLVVRSHGVTPLSNVRTWRTSRTLYKDINNEKIKFRKKSQIILVYTIYTSPRKYNITVHVRTNTNDIICIVSGTHEKLFRVIGTCGQFPAHRNRQSITRQRTHTDARTYRQRPDFVRYRRIYYYIVLQMEQV